MTKKDFFRIVIKLFGLYFFVEILFTIITSIITLLGSDSFFYEGLSAYSYTVITLVVCVAIVYFLIRHADWFIHVFKLDKGFDDNTMLFEKFNGKKILLLGIILLSGYFIVENVPLLLAQIYQESVVHNNPYYPKDENSTMQILISLIKIIIGAGLLTFRETIVDYFDR